MHSFSVISLLSFCLVLPFILVSPAVAAAFSMGTLQEVVGAQGPPPSRGSLGERMWIFNTACTVHQNNLETYVQV